MWEKDEPAPEAEEEAAGGAGGSAANGGSASRERLEVVVSDVADANAIYVQARGCGGGERACS